MDIVNFPGMIAQYGLLTGSDISIQNDLVVIGKKVNDKRDGSQYEEMTMTVQEFLTLASGTTGWNLNGNTVTLIKTLGTIDNFDLPFITNNVERARISNTGQFGLGTAAPVASAKMEMVSTTQGFLGPRMTEAQMNAIAAPATGLLVYQTNGTNPGFYEYTGTFWKFVGLYASNYYVDALAGNDTRALPNRPDRPYLTVTAALAAAVSGTPSLIYVRRGAYTDAMVTLKDLVDIYYEPGSTLTGGGAVVGWQLPNNTVTNCKITGGLKCVGNVSIYMENNCGGSNVVLEVDEWNSTVYYAVTVIPTDSAAYLSMSVRKINSTVTVAQGRIFALGGYGNLILNVSDSITANRRFLRIEGGVDVNVEINCPNSYMTGVSMFAVAYDNSFIECADDSYYNLTINGNMTNQSGVSPVNDVFLLFRGAGSYVTINGNTEGNRFPAIETTGTVDMRINGNVKSRRSCILHGSGSSIFVNSGIIQTRSEVDGIQTLDNVITVGAGYLANSVSAKFYAKNCTIKSVGTTCSALIRIREEAEVVLFNTECFNQNILTGLLGTDAVAGVGTAVEDVTLSNAGGTLTNGQYLGVAGNNLVGAGTGATFNVTVAGGIITQVIPVERGIGYLVNDTLDFTGTIVGGHTEVITIATVATTMMGCVNVTSNVDNKTEIGRLFTTTGITIDPKLQSFTL